MKHLIVFGFRFARLVCRSAVFRFASIMSRDQTNLSDRDNPGTRKHVLSVFANGEIEHDLPKI